MSVLLIGSTGMGKSTLGNFLLDPDEKHMFANQTFAIPKSNRPMAQEVKVASQKVRLDDSEVRLQLIDTPGLNESAAKDLSHMIDVIKRLNECGEIRACILVVKFNAKIDAQYKATIKYYSRLLLGLFDKNVIIVMTDFATDERSEKRREMLQIDVEDVKQNTIFELGQCSNNQIMYSPQLFTIDCLPLEEAEKEISLTVRKAILDYIFQLTPIKVKNQLVAKTDYVKQKDAEKYEKLQGEIIGYNERLKEVHTNSKKVLDQTREKKIQITEIESKINDLEKNLKDKDTEDDVVVEQWSHNKDWKMFKRSTQDFNIESEYEISNHTTWTNGKCTFKDVVQTSHAVSGKVEGKLMRGIYATVTVYIKKRTKYANEIEDLKGRLRTEKINLSRFKAEWEDFQKSHEKNSAEIRLLEEYIAERRVSAEKCQSEIMTIEDAAIRLEELKQTQD